MREIPLTQGKVAIVDDADYDRVIAQGSWFAVRKPHTWYAARTIPHPEGGVMKNGKPRRIQLTMHQFLTENEKTDHKNHNGLDNRMSNLRSVTDAQNKYNEQPRVGGTSRFKGVSWVTREGKWLAQIKVKGRNKYLGIFSDEIKAAKAYDRGARFYFGEFACCNFSEE